MLETLLLGALALCSTEVSIVIWWQLGLTCEAEEAGLWTDSGAIHRLCPGFPMPPVVDLGVGKKLGGGEGGARAAIVNGCCSPLCLVEVFC